MASSSADIVAVCRAVSKICKYPISHWEISNTSRSIEPSDGVMYDTVVAYDFINGKLLEEIGPIIPMRVITIDDGNTVDTINFQRKTYTNYEMKQVLSAYHLAIQGIKNKDIELLGRATTISARINQRRHYKKHLEHILSICADLGSYGVSVAHSGSIISLLFNNEDCDKVENAKSHLQKLFLEATIHEIVL